MYLCNIYFCKREINLQCSLLFKLKCVSLPLNEYITYNVLTHILHCRDKLLQVLSVLLNFHVLQHCKLKKKKSDNYSEPETVLKSADMIREKKSLQARNFF